MTDESEQSPYANLAKKIRGGKSASTKDLESRAPQITVIRGEDESPTQGTLGIHNLFGGAVSSFAFQVQVDGETVGALEQNQRIKFELAPGGHHVRITTPIASSDSKYVLVENGQRVKFSCRSKFTGIIIQEI